MTDNQEKTENLKVENSFSYNINPMPGKVRKKRRLQDLFAPRNSSKTRMYILFVLGSVALVLISFIAVNGVNFYGQSTYISYALDYFKIKPEFALTSLIIMFIVNIFWITTNLIIEFLAFSRNWIPSRIKQENIIKTNSFETKVFKSNIDFDEISFRANIAQEKTINSIEDKAQFEDIISNPYLSPLAYFWSGLKAVYNSLKYLPSVIYIYWMRFLKWNEKGWFELKLNLRHTLDLIVYFLNPFNLIDEIIDTLVTLLVKFFYPWILTPVIFFIPIRYSIYLQEVWQVLIYFILIGGLRLGVEFFSIYIRFLRNTRLQ
jgi:hypothetical protein